jgi:hypothetical protein
VGEGAGAGAGAFGSITVIVKIVVRTNIGVVAVIVTFVAACGTVGVPVISPVTGSSESPAGRLVLVNVGSVQKSETTGGAIELTVFTVNVAATDETVGSISI